MISIRAGISDSLYRSTCGLAEEEGIPFEQPAGFAIAQGIGAWMSQRNLIQERARRATGEGWERLKHIPDVPSIPSDELPEKS